MLMARDCAYFAVMSLNLLYQWSATYSSRGFDKMIVKHTGTLLGKTYFVSLRSKHELRRHCMYRRLVSALRFV